MIVYEELAAKLDEYLGGSVSECDLYEWVAERSWNMHKDSHPRAIDLASSIELIFAELSSPIDKAGTLPDFPPGHVRSELTHLRNRTGRWAGQ